MDAAVQNLVKRLEAVTARLETVEKQIASGASAGSLPAASSGGAASGDVSASVSAYDELVATYIKPLVQGTQQIGNDELKAQVALLEKAVNAQKDFIACAANSKKPDAATLMKLVEPTSKLMQEISALRDKHRANKLFNHLSTLSEGVSCLGWVCVEPTPGPFVNEARGSSEFYSNKLLVEYKKTNDQPQLDWVHNWNTFMKELFNYVKKFHTTGLSWNPRGGEAASFKSGSGSATPAAAPPAAPKGLPPPMPISAPPPAAAGGAGPDPSALFAAINKGGAITSGLKKVTKEMKNKNQEQKSSVVPAEVASKKSGAAPKAAAGQKKGTPKFELQGNKWLVEWQENTTIDITETEVKQVIYIYKCEKAVVNIKGKVNAITVDGCKRTAVVFESAVASCEVVNGISIEIQCQGKVPSIAVDKSSGVQLFLSKDGLEVEIVTSKSDSLNVLIPDPAGGVDPVEIAVPEQFKTLVKNGKLVTTTVEHV
jgi:adenylyl cyclase-associated protein